MDFVLSFALGQSDTLYVGCERSVGSGGSGGGRGCVSVTDPQTSSSGFAPG